MARIVYLGSEIGAAGYRLAGLAIRTPADTPDEVGKALREAVESGVDCILLAGPLAQLLPAAQLQEALCSLRPLLAIVPELHGRGRVPDLTDEVRAALGIEA
jgi:vacuolar-type H+-ATPase subunit F/Vma7